ncbi:MAG: TlpA disulfide reductase family protein [Bacteroidota bacterium]
MKNPSLLLFALFATQTLYAQKLDLKKLDEFSVETSETRSVEMPNRKPERRVEKYTYQFKNMGETAEGYKLSCTMVRANIRREYSSLFLFNSDSIRNSLTNSSSILGPLFFLEKSFTVYIGRDGKLQKTEGIEQLLRQGAAKWHLEESTMEYYESTPRDMAIAIKKIFLELPEQKIAYQSTWDNKATGVNYKVTAIAGSLLTITGAAADTLTARYTLNDVNGLLEDAKIHWKKVVPKYQLTETIDYSQKLIYDKYIKATVDTAWANMAVMLSFRNGALTPKTDNAVDSAVAFTYFKQYDPQFSNDPYYMKQKVTLVNQMRLKSYDIYKALVLKTPHKYLTDVELENKMRYVMETDIDQIYDFIKFRSNTTALYHTLQTGLVYELFGDNYGTQEQQISSYVRQGLTEEKARQVYMERERGRANKMLLLERLFNEKDPLLRQKVVPMYNWYLANKDKQNIAVLKKSAAQLKKLNRAEMVAGNGGRYTIFLYKLLADAGLNDEAEEMLDKTITDYDYLVLNDTAYNSGSPLAIRNAESARNLLMVANYLKYKEVSKVDSLKALAYLAKAAQHSPVGVLYSSSGSSSDRNLFEVRMNLKGTYRKDYIEKLFAMGDTDLAMKMFAVQINVDMGSIVEMQKMFEKRFPDKKFSDFIINNTIAAWKMAPDWTAKDVDGKVYKLSDYKGKWLILDYWATWCPPCRAEMPKVFEFTKELSSGKHPGIAFLGVASDEERDVRKYFDETKLIIPTVLQDNGLSTYGVTGIPSKCLIAPNGKMIVLPLGIDWKTVVTKLNQLYAAN